MIRFIKITSLIYLYISFICVVTRHYLFGIDGLGWQITYHLLVALSALLLSRDDSSGALELAGVSVIIGIILLPILSFVPLIITLRILGGISELYPSEIFGLIFIFAPSVILSSIISRLSSDPIAKPYSGNYFISFLIVMFVSTVVGVVVLYINGLGFIAMGPAVSSSASLYLSRVKRGWYFRVTEVVVLCTAVSGFVYYAGVL